MSPTDAQLATRIAGGDRNAAGILVQRYQHMVRSFLMRLCGRDDMADDLAQETFLRVLRYADRYDPKYGMHTWLLTIARRLWINDLRHRRRRQTNPVTDEPASREMNPETLVSRGERHEVTRKMIDEAMTRLTDAQRTAMLLFHQQEMSMADAAEVMQMPVGTVKSHLHRGRATLRRILAPDMEKIEP